MLMAILNAGYSTVHIKGRKSRQAVIFFFSYMRGIYVDR